MVSEGGFLPKDFIRTAEGLHFAIVDGCPEDGRLLCTLRYVPTDDGRLRKLGTAEAAAFLQEHHPDYLRRSRRLDATLPAVPIEHVVRHSHPRDRIQALLAERSREPMEAKTRRLLGLFAGEGLDLAEFGLTGSLLIGAQTSASDIDLVIYDRGAFDAARAAVAKATADGRLSAPGEADWREAYRRRGCTLAFEDYLRHERRKFNAGFIEGAKFDLMLVLPRSSESSQPAEKRGSLILRTTVTDDRGAFESPARYRTDHPRIGEILSFTHTYAGQARTGERIEASGLVEALPGGGERLIVGSSREAPGEYIRVLRDDTN
jgi:predicted nucleotidyltransferase